ncbi:CheR family methyltransferase [Roseimaritima ulvae]|uniref:CheR family methyltransferase n=1 Tax=Roseimaritima ulvae TaxID=980254 RepID=UPI0013901150|nr:CheR family methyltransferase [Roseimaritima ulvae]
MTKQESKPPSPPTHFPIVGIGSSAGGFDAIRRLLEAMPDHPGVALVIVQHLAPDKPSLASGLLARYTKMDVRQVHDQSVVEPDHVYVIPPGKLLSIAGGKFQLTPMEGPRHPPVSVDFFFRALAKDQRECAVGVILSGTGSDGALGVKAIKEAGGLVLVQEVDSAEHGGMPEQAIRSGVVDQVLAPEAIPEALIRFANHDYICGDAALPELETDASRSGVSPRLAEVGSETDETGASAGPANDAEAAGDNSDKEVGLDAIVKLLRTSGNSDFRGYKEATLLRRTRRRMCLRHIDKVEDYLAYLEESPAEIKSLAGDLLISVTDFFRDPDAWDDLANHVIPEIVGTKSADEAVRVWVAGCATGEEAYTIAMLMQEEIGKQQRTSPLQIFASDIDKRALDEARAGQYPVSIVADVSAERIQRFFKLEDGDLHFQVNKSLRETIVFAEQNMLADPPFSHLDLILCRNVLIYLKPDMQQKLIGLFHFALRQHGYLVLGTAETVGRQDDLFETLHQRSRIYRGIGPTRHDHLDIPVTSGSRREMNEFTTLAPFRREQQVSHLAQEKLVDMMAPQAILVDRHWRMLYISGDVNPYILHRPGVPNENLLSKVREGLRSKLRGAVRKALAEKSNVSVRCRVHREGTICLVRVEVRYVSDRASQEAFALIVFDELENNHPTLVSDIHRSTGASEIKEMDVDEDSIIRQLEDELAATKDDLQITVEQFEASNEEFKASNEEVMSINEELQSTNEELETSKEELQSLNEELSTVNLQLASKVEELEVKHADLENLVSATDIATVCLDTDFKIRWFTPAARQFIRIQKSDIGRPLEDLQHDFDANELKEEYKKVMRRLIPLDNEVDCTDSRSFIRRTVPYRADDHRIGGVVITMVEISKLRQRETQLRASEGKLLSLTKNLESQVRERTELLGILQHVTRLANEATSIDEALQSSLAKITEFNGWCVGHAWRLADDSSADDPQLESSGIWHVSADAKNSTANGEFQEFQRITAGTRFTKGDGLVGRRCNRGSQNGAMTSALSLIGFVAPSMDWCFTPRSLFRSQSAVKSLP